MIWLLVRQFKQNKHAVRNCAATQSVKVPEYITVVHVTLLLGIVIRSYHLGWNISFILHWLHFYWLTIEVKFVLLGTSE